MAGAVGMLAAGGPNLSPGIPAGDPPPLVLGGVGRWAASFAAEDDWAEVAQRLRAGGVRVGTRAAERKSNERATGPAGRETDPAGEAGLATILVGVLQQWQAAQ
eukprot:7936503-Alexandrium_andersonii.AAC.1